MGGLRLLLGKPGLDGHSNGAEQIAVRARDAGFEVIYQGIRLTTEQIAAAAVAEDVQCVGLSILSGAHAEVVPDVLRRLRQAGAADIPVVVGGIIPAADAESLRSAGVAAVFTPKDFGITDHRRPHRRRDPARPRATALAGPSGQPGRDDLAGRRWTRRGMARTWLRPSAGASWPYRPPDSDLPTDTATFEGWHDLR